MSDADEVEAQIPRLSGREYRIESCKDPRYNCFAWAAGDNTRVWSPTLIGGGVHWPPGIPAFPSLGGVLAAYQVVGFSECEHGALEHGYEQLAVFTDPTGDPRQLLGNYLRVSGSAS